MKRLHPSGTFESKTGRQSLPRRTNQNEQKKKKKSCSHILYMCVNKETEREIQNKNRAALIERRHPCNPAEISHRAEAVSAD